LDKWKIKSQVLISLIESFGEALQIYFPRRDEYMQWKLENPDRLETVAFQQQQPIALVNSVQNIIRAPNLVIPRSSVVQFEQQKPITESAVLSRESSEQSSQDILGGVQKIFDYIKGIDQNSIFLEPVTEDVAPGYFSIIESPMDLQTILQRAKNSMYSSLHEACEDVELMFQNCLTYNNKGDYYYTVYFSFLCTTISCA